MSKIAEALAHIGFVMVISGFVAAGICFLVTKLVDRFLMPCPPDDMRSSSPVIHPVERSTSVKNQWFETFGVDPLILLSQRLRLTSGMAANTLSSWAPLDHISVYIDENRAHIHYIKDGVAGMLEDSASLFPSDELLAKMKLIMQ